MAYIYLSSSRAWLFTILLVSAYFSANGLTVEIDTTRDMSEYGIVGDCTSHETFDDLIACKGVVDPVSNEGFWSSCALPNCEITINIGRIILDVGEIPTRLDILSFVTGDSSIRVQYQLSSGDLPVNLGIIRANDNWVIKSFSLLSTIAWTGESVSHHVAQGLSRKPYQVTENKLTRYLAQPSCNCLWRKFLTNLGGHGEALCQSVDF